MHVDSVAAYPIIHANRCVRYRFRYSACTRCEEACPHQALILSDEGAAIDWAKCQNCALCASACRTGTFQAANLPRVELLKQAAGAERWTFACAPSERTGNAVVPCLGAIEPTMLAYMASRGVAVELLGSEHCSRCSHSPQGSAQLALNLEGLAVLREALGGEAWATVTAPYANTADTHQEPEGQGANRRHFFRRVFGRAATQLAQVGCDEAAPAPLKAIRAAAPFLPGQRELLQVLWPRTAASTATLPCHLVLPIAQLAMAAGCTACEACARVCPTGALQIAESARAWELVFRLARCVGCAVCLEACQSGALRDIDPISIDASPTGDGVVLQAFLYRRCERCSRLFIPAVDDSTTCDVCTDDEVSFTTIFG
ncbi:MAG: 4Fe-4S dicluster domain-containing protein [Gammaproteobacteria bacterium]